MKQPQPNMNQLHAAFLQSTPTVKAALKKEDPQLYEALRVMPVLGTAKTYDQLRPAERAQLKKADPALHAKMSAGGLQTYRPTVSQHTGQVCE